MSYIRDVVISLGTVVNVLTTFSNANILKKYNIKGIDCPLLISINIVIF